MPGPVPGIHDLNRAGAKAWMAGTSPATTINAYVWLFLALGLLFLRSLGRVRGAARERRAIE